MESRRALILVGHGSHLNADSSAPVYQHAARLRAGGAFDEVVEAFWKEEPCLRDALDLVSANEVFVVPLFLAEGYFTREVLPRELGIDGAITRRDGRTIRYCPPVGTHPSLAGLILRRARSVAGLPETARREAALVVIGHGTERSATSGDTVYELVERLRREGEFGTVACGFLDEEPGIAGVLEGIAAPDVVLVPFFVAEGWHTRETIPSDLRLTGERTERGGRTVWYTPPVGTLPEIADLVLEIVAEQEAHHRARPEATARAHPAEPAVRAERAVRAETAVRAERAVPPGPAAAMPARRAREAFFDWLHAGRAASRVFLQLAILPVGEDRWALLHRDDASSPLAGLVRHDDPERALALARTAASGDYRPLRTAGDLPRGWVFPSLDPDELWTALAYFYPAAVAAWHRHAMGELEILSFERWAARQTAMYSGLRDLPANTVRGVVGSLCGTCLRTRLWHLEAAEEVVHPREAHDDTLVVPCREPCTLFATRAREHGGLSR